MRKMITVCFVLLALAVAAGADSFHIITSFYPIYIATLNVAKDVPDVEVINLTRPITGCLHDYELAPEDMKTLAAADVFVINGAGIESFLDEAIRLIPDMKIINASENIPLIQENPHVWVSISLAMKQVKNIVRGLAEHDPRHADLYKRNADAYLAQLEALRRRMQEQLQHVKTRKMVTFHEAFPFFAKEFDLNIVAVIEREPGSEPSARELAETIDVVRKSGVTALFIEPQYPAKAADTIARETGAKIYTLDPAVTGPMEAEAYIRIMEKNLIELNHALSQ